MKIKVSGFINNINQNIKTEINCIGIKNNNKIIYIHNYTKYTLTLKTNIIYLKRENKECVNTITFIKRKETQSEYIIKNLNIRTLINIYTKIIKITSQEIYIEYLIKDSEEKYIYRIEVNELNEK